jgi:hypothetical protein
MAVLTTTPQPEGRAALVRRSIQLFGLPATLADLGVSALNRLVFFKALKGVTIQRVSPEFLDCPDGYRGAFLTETQLREVAKDPEHRLPKSFLDEALARADDCYGIFHGETLASFGWYSTRATRIDPPDLWVNFAEPYVYMYHGFTHPAHRGKRLHAIGMTQALASYLSRGFRGFVSYVESTNYASRKSTVRMGYSEFGTIVIVRIAGRYLIHRGSGCSPFGFHIQRRLRQ